MTSMKTSKNRKKLPIYNDFHGLHYSSFSCYNYSIIMYNESGLLFKNYDQARQQDKPNT